MNAKQIAGYRAAELVEAGMTVGLGTGSTAYFAIERIGQRVQQGLSIQAVATSVASAEQAQALGIPLLDIDQVRTIDLTIDGVDEVDPNFHGIKGGGGALFREKIVASASRRNVWILDPSKLVSKLGAFRLPVEVLPFGYTHVEQQLRQDGFDPILRQKDGAPFVTNNGNYILDLQLNDSKSHEEMADYLIRTVGVLEHGLFLGTTDLLIVGRPEGAQIIEKPLK